MENDKIFEINTNRSWMYGGFISTMKLQHNLSQKILFGNQSISVNDGKRWYNFSIHNTALSDIIFSSLNDVCLDELGYLWIFTNKSCYRLKDHEIVDITSTYPEFVGGDLFSLMSLPNGEVYVGIRNGLAKFNHSEGFTKIKGPISYTSYGTCKFGKDNKLTIFNGYRIGKIENDSVIYNKENIIAESSIDMSFDVSKDGIVWANLNEHLGKFENNKWEYFKLDSIHTGKVPFFVRIDSKDNLWFLSSSGVLAKWNQKDKPKFQYVTSTFDDLANIVGYEIDKFDNIWIAKAN